jgi:hypothetical protein
MAGKLSKTSSDFSEVPAVANAFYVGGLTSAAGTFWKNPSGGHGSFSTGDRIQEPDSDGSAEHRSAWFSWSRSSEFKKCVER